MIIRASFYCLFPDSGEDALIKEWHQKRKSTEKAKQSKAKDNAPPATKAKPRAQDEEEDDDDDEDDDVGEESDEEDNDEMDYEPGKCLLIL